jgi:hypothetical protein
MRARLAKIVYLTAVAVAMAGWVWLIVDGVNWFVR